MLPCLSKFLLLGDAQFLKIGMVVVIQDKVSLGSLIGHLGWGGSWCPSRFSSLLEPQRAATQMLPPPSIVSSLVWPPACFVLVDDLEFVIIHLLPGTTDLCYQSRFILCQGSNLWGLPSPPASYISQPQLCLLVFFFF